MRWILMSLWILAGCDSPGIGYSAAEVTRVERGGYVFSLRRSGDFVQVIRTNFLRRPDINLIGQQAELSIEQTFGCRVTKMQGDVALMVAEMDCDLSPDAAHWVRWVKPRRSQMSCLGDVFSNSTGRGQEFEVSCF